jgi:hypothetical protein
VTNRSTKSSVVLIVDTADTPFHFIAVFLVKVFHYIKLYIPPPLGSESIDRVDISNGLERFAHQH